MDEIELLVEETYRHFHQHYNEQTDMWVPASKPIDRDFSALPENSGIIYHIQKSRSIFVIRTLVSHNIRKDYSRIVQYPTDYPSLRLIDPCDKDTHQYLKFFMVDDVSQAKVIHDQLHNRRFPILEEVVCNISDPGFSWWLSKKENAFQVSFTLSVLSDEHTVKLGPLGDKEIAVKKFKELEDLICMLGIDLNIQNEMNRVQFNGGENLLIEELRDLFEFGVMSDTLKKLFVILDNQISNKTLLEQSWLYLNELATMRRFWIQIQYDLNLEES